MLGRDAMEMTKNSGGAAAIEPKASEAGLNRRRAFCFWSLCISVFLTGLFNRYFEILIFEWSFIYLYTVLLRPLPVILASIKRNQLIFGLFILWAASVTVSLLVSPLHISSEPTVIMRYLQTLSHVLFFFFVRDFVIRHAVDLKWPLLAIPLSVVTLAAIASVLLLGEDLSSEETSARWFNLNPFNAHIRHTGYLATAAVGIMIGFCLRDDERATNRQATLLLLIILMTFLLWTGGRGAALSVVAAFGATSMVVWLKGGSVRFLGAAFAISIVAGLALSEFLAVFPWNGVLQMVSRSIVSENLDQLSSGRVDIWRSTWDSVKDHLVFGLGPHGYAFMPNRIFGVQPHTMVLQFLVEWGIVGTLLFSTLLIIGFTRGLRAHVLDVRGSLDPMRISAGALIVALTVHGLYDGTYFQSQTCLYLALCFAVWSAPSQRALRS